MTQISHDFSTPMMKQYIQIKEKFMDCLLLYRMGDFYELFLDDAHIGARVLNITLTSRPKGRDGRIPMAGVPYHAVDSYIAKLVKAGYKVAICEQVSLPNKQHIIDREVVRIITPGTMLDEKALDKKAHNYIISLQIFKQTLAISICDLSTGYFATYEKQTPDIFHAITNELARLQPTECILPPQLYNSPPLLKVLKQQTGLNIYDFSLWDTYTKNAATFLKKHFGVSTLAGLSLEDKKLAQQTAAALLGYLEQTQKAQVQHVKRILVLEDTTHVHLDRSTIMNLELFTTIREHDHKASFVSLIDTTITAMGGRLLRQWICKPLLHPHEINKRLDVVELFVKNTTLTTTIQDLLTNVSDIERLLSRLSVGLGNARDMQHVKETLIHIMEIKKLISSQKPALLVLLAKNIDPSIQRLIHIIDDTITLDPPIDTKSGGFIKAGVDAQLDSLRNVVGKSKKWLTTLEQEERKKTGISSLKIKYNQVFGFSIEVSKANLSLVPASYIRRQTLTNGERFITQSLKEQEDIILSASEKMHALEYKLFNTLLATLMDHMRLLQDAAESIAVVDCLVSFALNAQKEHYIRPTFITSGHIHISQGRHPVVEKLLEETLFVPNDVSLTPKENQLLVITGPNMAGKSVFIRQVALLVLMAQMGSFIPAEKADITPVDRIFVRSGASDVITSGLSTFMVEMVETAYILNHATKDSLIIMDEIGRGTSTYDGISLAWAIAEYLVTNPKQTPKTLFATHYHELQALAKEYPNRIQNYHMAVTQKEEKPLFLHTLLPGGASHSFGISVATLAGIPEEVTKNAHKILHRLETREPQTHHTASSQKKSSLASFLETITIENTTPLEALHHLATLKEKAKGAHV